MADSPISGLTAGTVTAANEFPFVQSGVTKRDTIQGILDLVPSSLNLGSADLSADANTRKYTLYGALAANTLVIENSAGADIASFRGDQSVKFTGNVSINTNPSTIIQSLLSGSGVNYGYYATGSSSTASFAAQNTGTTPSMFLASKVSSTGFKAEGNTPSAATADRFGFDCDFSETNSSDNVCFRANAANAGAGEAVAIEIVAGDIKLPSGGIGFTGTGSYTNFTIEKGIITAAS